MPQPTSSLTRFVGPIYTGTTPPTAAIVGKDLEAGMVYFDNDLADPSLCVYDGTDWDCVALTAAQPTSTSTSTTTSTTTSTSTSTSTTTT